jgi:hypothetical protein
LQRMLKESNNLWDIRPATVWDSALISPPSIIPWIDGYRVRMEAILIPQVITVSPFRAAISGIRNSVVVPPSKKRTSRPLQIGGATGRATFFFSGMFGLADGEWRLLRDAGDGDRPTLKGADQTRSSNSFDPSGTVADIYPILRPGSLWSTLSDLRRTEAIPVPLFANHNQFFISLLAIVNHYLHFR